MQMVFPKIKWKEACATCHYSETKSVSPFLKWCQTLSKQPPFAGDPDTTISLVTRGFKDWSHRPNKTLVPLPGIRRVPPHGTATPQWWVCLFLRRPLAHHTLTGITGMMGIYVHEKNPHKRSKRSDVGSTRRKRHNSSR